jgi:hypothetical protein
MFFYLVISYKSLICKLGITRRLPICRLTEYSTFDITCDYYSIAYFPNIVLEQLLIIEKNCLSATKQWALCLDRNPNAESRYEVSPEILWSICEKYFPSNVVIYKTRNKILTLTIEECPSALETESKETEFFADKKHFSSLEELNSFIPVETYNERSNDRSIYNPMTLRGYQIEAYEHMKRILSTQSICTMSIMCRCGKTELFKNYTYYNRNEFQIVIYVAPRLSLISDMTERFADMLVDYKYIEVSSNKQSKYSVDDAYLIKPNNENKLMIFVCNDSFIRLEPIFKKNTNKLIIFDEAHHLATKKSDVHPLLLLNKWKQSNIKIIFATATPTYGNYKIYKDIVVMNDPEYFGDYTSNTIKFNDITIAINQKFMTEAKIIIGDLEQHDSKHVLNTDEKHVLNTDEKQSPEPPMIQCNKRIINAISLFQDVCMKSPRTKVLFYCSRIVTVILCYSMLLKYLPTYTIFKLESNMSNADKTKSLLDFKSCKTPCILVNCQMVTDGINIVDLDTVVYVDPKYAKSDLVQSSMRPRSYDLNKPNKIAYIIIPQIYNGEVADEFTSAVTIIKELHMYNDPSVVKFINECIESKKASTNKKENSSFSSNVIIREDIKHRIIELTNLYISAKTNLTMPDAIKEVLSDGLPRNVKQIWKEIEERKLHSSSGLTPEATCNASCSIMSKQGKIICIDEKPKIYYKLTNVIKNIWSIGRFIEEMRLLDIDSEIKYREMFGDCYTDETPVNPSDVYKNFKWELLIKSYLEYYETKEECESAINRLVSKEEVMKHITTIYSPAKRLEYLRSMDKKIAPYSGIEKIYKVEPKKLNQILDNKRCSDIE